MNMVSDETLIVMQPIYKLKEIGVADNLVGVNDLGASNSRCCLTVLDVYGDFINTSSWMNPLVCITCGSG